MVETKEHAERRLSSSIGPLHRRASERRRRSTRRPSRGWRPRGSPSRSSCSPPRRPPTSATTCRDSATPSYVVAWRAANGCEGGRTCAAPDMLRLQVYAHVDDAVRVDTKQTPYVVTRLPCAEKSFVHQVRLCALDDSVLIVVASDNGLQVCSCLAVRCTAGVGSRRTVLTWRRRRSTTLRASSATTSWASRTPWRRARKVSCCFVRCRCRCQQPP